MKLWNAAFVFVPAVSTLAQTGEWEPEWFQLGDATHQPIVAVHLVHVYTGTTGKVLVMSWDELACGCTSHLTRLWTPPAAGVPGAGIFESTPYCVTHMACGGGSALADGRVFIGGGNYDDLTALFDPRLPASAFPSPFCHTPQTPWSNQWNNPQAPPELTYRRWYPTCTTLANGTVLISSGDSWGGCSTCMPPIPPTPVTSLELYNPGDNSLAVIAGDSRDQDLYPYMFVLPDGNLVDAGPGEARMLRSANWSWAGVIANPSWPTPPPTPPGLEGSAVMYEPGKIMRCGGQEPAVKTTFTVNLIGANPSSPPSWLVAADMNKARRNHNLVILPDGKILAVGGNVTGTTGLPAVFEAEIFDPASGKWTLQPPSDASQRRHYHSSALLLRDGRVVSAGGNDFPTAQIFKPPYLLNDAPRSSIVTAPATMQYDQQYVISYNRQGGPIATKACLIRLASVTHGFDQDQRRVPLDVPYEPPP